MTRIHPVSPVQPVQDSGPFSTAFHRPNAATHAFSLVEVVLAIGVVAFGFLAIFALLPAGFGIFRKAMETSIGSQIAQRVINDAQQTDFSTLVDLPNLPPGEAHRICPPRFTFRGPKVNEPGARYFDDQGEEIVPAQGSVLSATEKQRVIYWVATRIMPRSEAVGATTDDQDSDRLATLTVQVVQNPSNLALTFYPAATDTDPNRNLVVPARGISIVTHAVLISRNQ